MTIVFDDAANLLAAYFHQDWPTEFGTEQAAIAAMLQSEQRPTILAAANQLRQMLESKPSDAELRKVMVSEIGCYFDPTADGQAYSNWLSELAGKLEGSYA